MLNLFGLLIICSPVLRMWRSRRWWRSAIIIALIINVFLLLMILIMRRNSLFFYKLVEVLMMGRDYESWMNAFLLRAMSILFVKVLARVLGFLKRGALTIAASTVCMIARALYEMSGLTWVNLLQRVILKILEFLVILNLWQLLVFRLYDIFSDRFTIHVNSLNYSNVLCFQLLLSVFRVEDLFHLSVYVRMSDILWFFSRRV